MVTCYDELRATIRPVRPDDAGRLQAFVLRLSPETIFQRWRVPMDELPESWARELAEVDHRSQTAIVATRDNAAGEEEIVGVANYALTGDRSAPAGELAFVVEDSCQGRGLGRLLLDCLIERAHLLGLRRLAAMVNYQNTRVLHMLRTLGVPVTVQKSPCPGEIQLELDLSALELSAPEMSVQEFHSGESLD